MTLYDPASMDDAFLAHEHELERAVAAARLEAASELAEDEELVAEPALPDPERLSPAEPMLPEPELELVSALPEVVLEPVAPPAELAPEPCVEAPDASEAPEVPRAHEASAAPEVPPAHEATEAPEVPRAHEASEAPEVPPALEISEAPELPQALEAPEALENGAPRAMEAEGTSPDEAPETPEGVARVETPSMETPSMEAPEAPGDGSLELAPAFLRPALERRGFATLTSVQRAVLEPGTDRRDLRISSQTGSGKTVALGFALAELLQAEAPGARGPRVLVVVPTRELARQVSRELDWLFEDLGHVAVGSVVGGGSYARDERLLRSRPAILVGTPGRLVDHLRGGRLDLASLGGLVLDEADQMLDLGFREELDALVGAAPTERRTHLVSATFPDAVRQLCERYQGEALHVEGTRLGDANQDIEHRAHLVHAGERTAALVNLLLEAGEVRTLVFVERRSDAAELTARLVEEGFDAHGLSGELAQTQRERTLAAFCASPRGVLVATDVAARGLDLPDVRLVVHTAPPLDAETYTHRSGRTGRAGQRGSSVMLVAPSRRRRVTRLLAEAGVELCWTPLPVREELEELLASRRREELLAAIATVESGEEAEERLALSRELLEGREPEQVVAALLGRLQPTEGPRPRDVEALEVRPDRGRRNERGERPRRPVHGERRPRRDGPRGGHGPDVEHGYVRFFLNRGASHGASPGRVLATVCRRGGISGDDVGSIAVHPNGTTFDVRAEVCEGFEERASRPDRRDPGTRIRRDRGPAGPGGPHRRGPRRPRHHGS